MSKQKDDLRAAIRAARPDVPDAETDRLSRQVWSVLQALNPPEQASLTEKRWPFATVQDAIADFEQRAAEPPGGTFVMWNAGLPNLHLRIHNTCWIVKARYIGQRPGAGAEAYDLSRKANDVYRPVAEYHPTSSTGWHFAEACWTGEPGS